MASIIEYITESYGKFVETYGDPRSKDAFMVRTPFPTLALVTAYLIFIKVIGPKYMENRKPYKLRGLMIGYNAVQAILAIFLFIMGGRYGWFTRYNWLCQPITHHPDDDVMLQLGWGFYMIRFLEFTDTIIFVLRKKFNQITTLHVVHHALVPLLFWLGLLTGSLGHYSFSAWLNALIHFFMYGYYMMAAMGEKYRKYIWWKKYMTKMQLTQFGTILVHTSYTLISDCDVPKLFGWVVIGQALLFFAMFYHFYQTSFNKTNQKKRNSVLPTMESLRKFSEACITNQDWVEENINQEEISEDQDSVVKNGASRRKIRVHSE